MNKRPEIDIRPALDRLEGEREDRIRIAGSRLKFGIPFIDAALGGLRKYDFVLLGAGSGAGKTEAAAQIAKVNVEAGKRVHYFALEAEPREIERRLKYRLLAKAFFKDEKRPKIHVSYRRWYDCEIDAEMAPYELQAEMALGDKYRTLTTIYRKREFFVENFEACLNEIRGETDLVIIDHLHYFDLDDSMNENQGMTHLVRRLRDLCLIHGVPTVLLAHVRKSDRRSKAIMPGLEDFQGSSNIYKVITGAVMLAPAYESGENASPKEWPTYMRLAKARIEGSDMRFIARCTFNSERNEYDPIYSLGKWREGLEEFQPIRDFRFMPYWATPRGSSHA